jgi:hypothetical protein
LNHSQKFDARAHWLDAFDLKLLERPEHFFWLKQQGAVADFNEWNGALLHQRPPRANRQTRHLGQLENVDQFVAHVFCENRRSVIREDSALKWQLAGEVEAENGKKAAMKFPAAMRSDGSQSRGYSNLCFTRVNLWLVLFCNES